MPRASFGTRLAGPEGFEDPSEAGLVHRPRPAVVAVTVWPVMRTSGATRPGPAGDPARVDRSNGPAVAPDGESCVAPDRSVFRHPLGPPTDSRRSPHGPRYPTSVPSAGDPAGRGAEGSLGTVLRPVNGFIHELADSREGCGQGPSVGASMWTARAGAGVGAAGGVSVGCGPGTAHRPTKTSPDDIHDLVGVGLGIPGLDGSAQAAGDMVFQHQQRDRVDGSA